MENSTPNFQFVYSNANEILVKSSVISTFPFSPIKLVEEQSDIKCCTYKQALTRTVNMSEFGSESAIIMEYKGRRIIFYNDNKPLTHIRFSILHELGHFINNHDFNVADKEVYGCYEVETNYFAAQLLMPEQVIREFIKRGIYVTEEFLVQHFNVSKMAAEKRIQTLAKTMTEWRSRQEKEFDDIILFKFAHFINDIYSRYQKKHFDFEEEYERQQERDSWHSHRKIYGR